MMYNNKFVTVVKVGGKILRELDGVVYIPFGSEYEISFKNLHTTRAKVSISIDDQDVLDGRSLVVDPNGDSSIEGFMRGNVVSHKFKFIEKTQEISDHRGDRISDGLIRVAFRFERALTIWDSGWVSFKDDGMIRSFPPNHFDGSRRVGGYNDNTVYGSSADNICSYSAQSASVSPKSIQAPVSDAGITVKGSASSQEFNTTTMGIMETVEHSIVIQLKGELRQAPVVQPLLVKTKVKCDTCGRVSFSGSKYCQNCGTSLVV